MISRFTGTAERDAIGHKREFCPFDFFDGEVKFNYISENQKICSGFKSTLSQCPSGSSLNMRFEGCETKNLNVANYECIGHWEESNKQYLAVIEWINGTEARYKCGVRYK